MAAITELPTLDTTAVVQAFKGDVPNSAAGIYDWQVFPLAEWKVALPTLPSGTYGAIASGDHSSSAGSIYFYTADNIDGPWAIQNGGDPIWTVNDQGESPTVHLNEAGGYVEVYLHRNTSPISGGAQYTYRYTTTDFGDDGNITSSLTALAVTSDKDYLPYHAGYEQLITMASGKQRLLKQHYTGGGTTNSQAVTWIERDSDSAPWRWNGKIQAQRIHPFEINHYAYGTTRAFFYEGNWWRLGNYRSVPTPVDTEFYCAWPCRDDDLWTPLAGYTPLVTPTAGYTLSGRAFGYVDNGDLYIFYTETNGSGEHRNMVAYRNSGSTTTAPLNSGATISTGGRLHGESRVSGQSHGIGQATTPDWADTISIGTVSGGANGYSITQSGGTFGSWFVKSEHALDALGNDLIAEWKQMRWDGLTTQIISWGFVEEDPTSTTPWGSNGTVFACSSNNDQRSFGELREKRGGSDGIQDEVVGGPPVNTFSQALIDTQGVDIAVVVHDAGTRITIYIDGSPVYSRLMTSSHDNPIRPSLSVLDSAGVATLSWESFDFQVLDGSDLTYPVTHDLTYSLTY